MLTDLEVAKQTTLLPISEIANHIGIQEDECESYGKYTAKIKLGILDRLKDKPDGKLILVTAMSPTNFGEGKTLTSIGLGQALNKIGKKAIVAIREPSLGPVFGMKGGAAGGGYSQVLPMELINLQFNGDFSAITTAHNLLAAMLDNHIIKGNKLQIDINRILWKRTMDMNDRALRDIVIGLGGSANGVPRETGFVITAASEVMAILALASSRADLKKRLGDIVVAYDINKQLVRASDIGAHKAMAVILNNAILPNLVQTTENTAALVHAGPFANIAHGTNSILADKIALKLADYVVTESGFGTELGAEKFFDIVCRKNDIYPSAVVIVATCRAIKFHGGVPQKPANLLLEENLEAFAKGLKNLEKHISNMKKFGVPVLVAINRFPFDTAKEIEMIYALCEQLGVACAPHEAFAKGGDGAIELAEKAVDIIAQNAHPKQKFLYDLEDSIEEKIRKIAVEMYGAKDIAIDAKVKRKLDQFVEFGFGNLPVCIAKTQMSLSDDPKIIGAPEGWTLTVSDINLSAGAGFLVAVCGNMMLMPGLPAVPAAMNMDVDEEGEITGLF